MSRPITLACHAGKPVALLAKMVKALPGLPAASSARIWLMIWSPSRLKGMTATRAGSKITAPANSEGAAATAPPRPSTARARTEPEQRSPRYPSNAAEIALEALLPIEPKVADSARTSPAALTRDQLGRVA